MASVVLPSTANTATATVRLRLRPAHATRPAPPATASIPPPAMATGETSSDSNDVPASSDTPAGMALCTAWQRMPGQRLPVRKATQPRMSPIANVVGSRSGKRCTTAKKAACTPTAVTCLLRDGAVPQRAESIQPRNTSSSQIAGMTASTRITSQAGVSVSRAVSRAASSAAAAEGVSPTISRRAIAPTRNSPPPRSMLPGIAHQPRPLGQASRKVLGRSTRCQARNASKGSSMENSC